MINSKSISITLVCLLLGLILSWQYRSIYDNTQAQTFQNKRLEDLKDELIMEKNNTDNLRKRNEELVNQVKEFENARGNINAYEQNLKKDLERAKIIAGLVSVRGAGVVITLDNNYEYSGTNDLLGKVTENDVLSVINELRATDAQAISINEERIVAMSEVRGAGGYIVVNGKRMKAPYTIKAIASPDKVENSLKMIGGLIENFQEYYKLKVTVEKKQDLLISKVKDDGSVIKINLLTPINK